MINLLYQGDFIMAAACGALNCAAFGPMEGKISPDAVWDMIHKNEKGK